MTSLKHSVNLARIGLLVLACAWFWAMQSAPVNAAIEVYEFDTPEQEQQFKSLGHTLRCPKCQNNSIADSNAELAQDLRQKVYEMTKNGHNEQEIVDYMIARYGNFVTYEPPLTLSTAILWFAPLSVLLIGVTVIVWRAKQSKSAEWDEKKEAQLAALLEEDQPDAAASTKTQQDTSAASSEEQQ